MHIMQVSFDGVFALWFPICVRNKSLIYHNPHPHQKKKKKKVPYELM
jgi:hypothetical protein